MTQQNSEAGQSVTVPRIAYLLSQYPAVSHTFFLTEIEALRNRGFQIETASINSVAPPVDGFSPREDMEVRRTFYVKAISKSRMAARLFQVGIRHPAVVLRGIRAAITLNPWDLQATLYAFFYLIEALLVGDWMRSKGCNHLHVHFSGPVATVALIVSMGWKVPFSLTVHGPDDFYNLENYYIKKKIARAKLVACISHFCRSQLLRIAPPEQWDKFHVCRLGVDEAVFRPTEVAHSAEVTRLVSIGRLHPSKGQPILLMALLKLIERGMPVHLELIGGGADRTRLEGIIVKQGIEQHVTLHGPLSHIATRNILQQADIFVLSSFAEGVPVALMEAMASEVACVSTFVAGVPELISSTSEGLLVPPASVDKLAEALEVLIHDPVRRQAIATAGRSKVLADYNLSRNADHLANVFRSYGLGTLQC